MTNEDNQAIEKPNYILYGLKRAGYILLSLGSAAAIAILENPVAGIVGGGIIGNSMIQFPKLAARENAERDEYVAQRTAQILLERTPQETIDDKAEN